MRKWKEMINESRGSGNSQKNLEVKCKWTTVKDLRRYRKVWPFPEKVKMKISEGITDKIEVMGND